MNFYLLDALYSEEIKVIVSEESSWPAETLSINCHLLELLLATSLLEIIYVSHLLYVFSTTIDLRKISQFFVSFLRIL